MQYEYALSIISDKYASEILAARPPLSMILDHLDYIVKLAGVDHVGIGSDFDGITSSPQQLDDVTSYPLITKGLIERGYNKKDIAKIMGGNIFAGIKSESKLIEPVMKQLIILLLLLPFQILAQSFAKEEIKNWEKQSKFVTIIRDQWGIPHIYGKSDADAVFWFIICPM